MSKLNVVGLGYIGLPTALMFASKNVSVVGTDINKELIFKLKNKEILFNEVGMQELFNKACDNNIQFESKCVSTNRYIIAVPTPYRERDKFVDLKYILEAINDITTVCKNKTIIVIESTISPGTIDDIIKPYIKNKTNKEIYLVHAPERVIPGSIIYELENNSRTIGSDNIEIGKKVKSWYKKFCKNDIIITNIKTAEMSKVVENTFRDINIAYANELAKICDKEDIDVNELISIANKHPRVNILAPGPGVGGHCIPVDPWFLIAKYPKEINIIKSAREVNDSMALYIFNKIKDIMKNNNINDYSKVGLYGLSYKENIDDDRKSPTYQLLDLFEKNNINNVKVYDPMINNKINNCETIEEF